MILRCGLLVLAARCVFAQSEGSRVDHLSVDVLPEKDEDILLSECEVRASSSASIEKVVTSNFSTDISSATSASSSLTASASSSSTTISSSSTISTSSTTTSPSTTISTTSSISTSIDQLSLKLLLDIQKSLSAFLLENVSEEVTKNSWFESHSSSHCYQPNASDGPTNLSGQVIPPVDIETSKENSLKTDLLGTNEYDEVNHINLSNISNIDLNDDAGDGVSGNSSRFMSFEEWKIHKDLEAQARASSDAQAKASSVAKDSTASTIDNSLEVILARKPEQNPEIKKDEGRTYKYKFNYASSDCAATVVSTNSDAKGASAILKEIKDSYLLNKCSTPNKFVVIELCQDILVNRVVMGNFELFSSMFKSVKFSVSESFPVNTEWKELGVFEANNIRDLQTFDIENPLIWARYLRIDILSHFDNEFYCPISLVRVHGTTMIEEFKGSHSSLDSTPSSETEKQPILSKELLNYTSEFSKEDDECRVELPYLALNEFLKDINSTVEHCIPLAVEESTISVESTAVKTTQESILKTIVKRLSLLESNASLSLLYVEEQSKLLSNAFTSLEKRHASKFDSLILKLNQTVTAQISFLEATLSDIRSESKVLFQTLEAGVDKKNHRLMRELSFQRTIIAIDTFLILALLAYVIITREFFISEETPIDIEETSRRPKGFPKQFAVHSARKIKPQKKKKGRGQ